MTPVRPGDDDEREDQAIAWLVRLNSGEATAEDWRGLETWLARDEANLSALSRVEALWGDLDDQAYHLKHGLLSRSGEQPLTFRRRRGLQRAASPPWIALAAAASVLLLIGGAGLATWRAQPAVYQTAPGQLRTIALSDGTRIDLNGGSHLEVRLAHDARRVKLSDAEAAFDVTHDPSRPFLITAGDERIRVVGTAFDLSDHDGRMILTVRRGVVEVSQFAGGVVGRAVRVPAGYQLVRDDRRPDASIAAVDPDEAVAWREHRLVYHDRPLRDVAADLDRAFTVPVEVSPSAADMRFSGVLVIDNEDAVITRLQAFLPIEVNRSDNRIVLNSRR